MSKNSYAHPEVVLEKDWAAENRPLTTETPPVERTDYKIQGVNLDLRALRDFVRESLGQANRGLVDVRSPKEYSGVLLAPENTPQEGSQRGGHIPGAANITWSLAVQEDGTFKPVKELQGLYLGKGITGDQELIAYCRISERSSHSWFVLKYLLGYPNLCNYDGSWTEWGSLIGVPIEKSAG